jgi:hypothetical protein
MATITIDGREYDSDKLSGAARQQITNIHAVDQELVRLKKLTSICQTARAAYAAALQGALPKDQ